MPEIDNALKRPDKYSYINKTFISYLKFLNTQYEVVEYPSNAFFTTNVDSTNGTKKTFSHIDNTVKNYHHYLNDGNTFRKVFIDL